MRREGTPLSIALRDDEGGSTAIDAKSIVGRLLPLIAARASSAYAERSRPALDRGERVVLAEPRHGRAFGSVIALVVGVSAVAFLAVCVVELATGHEVFHEGTRATAGRTGYMVRAALLATSAGLALRRLRAVDGSGLSISSAGLADERGDPSREIPSRDRAHRMRCDPPSRRTDTSSSAPS